MDGTKEISRPPERAPGRLDEVESRLDAIEGAFRRIGDGTYGSCESCHGSLPEDLLTTDPAARWCRSCAPMASS